MQRLIVKLVVACSFVAAGCAPPVSDVASAKGDANANANAEANAIARASANANANGNASANANANANANGNASASASAGASSTANGAGARVTAASIAPPPVPILEFDADWRVQQSGSVISGGNAIIHYDIARLPNCRATYMGFPAWDVIAYWATDGGPAFSQSLTTVTNAGRVATDITIETPPGRDFAMWFFASDEYGCTQWDSNYGRDFHFPTEPGPPTIHFPFPGFDEHVDGTLAAGGPILVDYDIRRLWECRQDYNGLQSWDVTMFYSIDGAAAQSLSVTTTSQNGRVAAPALFSVPAGARAVALWFENSDRTGCTAWDSRYGSNYGFSLQ